MRKVQANAVIGIVLILAGILFLLATLGVITLGAWLIAGGFGLGGLAFLFAFAQSRDHWWAVIPAMSLIGIGGLIAIGNAADKAARTLPVLWLFGALSLGFWLVYLRERSQWWAIVPGGVMLSLAGLIAAAQTGAGEVGVGVMFIGMGLTFALLATVRTTAGRMRWPLIPAAGLLLMGAAFIGAFTALLGYLWPVALIASGLVLVYLAFRPRRPA